MGSEEGRIWEIKGIKWDGCHDADAIDAVAQEAVDHVWKKLSRSRHHFQGMDKGRNKKLSNKEREALKHPVNRARWQMVQTDGYTHRGVENREQEEMENAPAVDATEGIWST